MFAAPHYGGGAINIGTAPWNVENSFQSAVESGLAYNQFCASLLDTGSIISRFYWILKYACDCD